jgi:transcriptional regulator with XRE-family HTH domain
MKERILEFLRRENKTSAQFAEEINVQPSGISHILSGRNNPSLDFILKMLEKYSYLSTDWLLFGKGSMYKESKMGDLFSQIDLNEPEKQKETDPKLKVADGVETAGFKKSR